MINAFCFLLFACSSCSNSITENSMRKFIDEIDIAISNSDIESIGKKLSDDVVVEFLVTSSGGERLYTASKEEYLSIVNKNSYSHDKYKYERKVGDIGFVNKKKAIVASRVYEVVTSDGVKKSFHTNEYITVELIRNTLLVTKMVGVRAE